MEDQIQDITLNVLVSIRDEIRALRTDTNARFEQMDGRFERIEHDISQIKQGMDAIVNRFDRDYLLLATEVHAMKRRIDTCEERLGITPN